MHIENNLHVRIETKITPKVDQTSQFFRAKFDLKRHIQDKI